MPRQEVGGHAPTPAQKSNKSWSLLLHKEHAEGRRESVGRLQMGSDRINFVLLLLQRRLGSASRHALTSSRANFILLRLSLFGVTKCSTYIFQKITPAPQLQAGRNENTCPHSSPCEHSQSCHSGAPHHRDHPDTCPLVSQLQKQKAVETAQ